MEILIYIGKVSLYWTLFYTCYLLFLRRQTFFVWNRIYLIGSLLISFALPFLIYPASAPLIPTIYSVNAAAVTIGQIQEKQPLFNLATFMWTIYVLGGCLMLYKFCKHVIQLRGFLKEGEQIELEDCNVVLINSNHIGSFSFLKWIVVNHNDYENHFDAILRHEMVHMQQKHTIDVLLVEFLKIVFWFNPILLLYKKSLQEVHEFLADSEAPNKERYATFLVSYALNAPLASLTNHFFKPSQIKTRIQMIYKNRTSKWLLSTYVLSLLTISMVALVVAGCEDKEIEELGELSKTFKAEDGNGVKFDAKKIFTVVEEQPEFPGGTSEMYKFLGQNIRYPVAAANANVGGRVFLSFVVYETGKVDDIVVLKGIGFGCDAEAVRVLKTFPKWTPGKQDGKPVSVKYNLPINFQIEDGDKVGKSHSSSKSDLNSKTTRLSNIAKHIENAVGAGSENSFTRSITVPRLPDDLGETLYQQSSPAISIKGSDSGFDAKNPPLYIVNGELINNTEIKGMLAQMPPDNIESISVLKGPSASSEYGSKGKNGVVLIKTKTK